MENKCPVYNNCNHIDCNSFCLRKYKLNYLYELSLIPEARRQPVNMHPDKNPETSDSEVFNSLKSIVDYIEDFVSEGNNIYIHSSICGNGKTTIAIKLVQAYFNKIWAKTNLECKALFINTPSFLLALKDNITEKSEYIKHIKENILKADIVIWDDIATKSTTVFESENLFSMIDQRMNLGKSNFYTSNLNEEDIHNALGDRLYSRIVNSSYDFELKGSDKRGLKLNG